MSEEQDFVSLELGDDYEDKPVSEGEYEVRVVSARTGVSKKGNPQVEIVCVIDEEPEAPAIYHYMGFPGEDDDDRQRRSKMRNITRFLKHFRVPFETSGFSPEDAVGCTAECMVVQEAYGDDGDISNRIRIPRAKDE